MANLESLFSGTPWPVNRDGNGHDDDDHDNDHDGARGNRHARRSAQHRRRRHQIRNGRRIAAVKAFEAAKGYLVGRFPTIQEAALCCGSNHIYVAAMLVLVRAEATEAIEKVLVGSLDLLVMARKLKPASLIIAACRHATATDLEISGRTLGSAMIWDTMVMPTL